MRLHRAGIALVAVLALPHATACKHHFDPREAAHVEQHAIAVGAPAPDAPLVSTSNTPVALADALRAQPRSIVVFYRGFF